MKNSDILTDIISLTQFQVPKLKVDSGFKTWCSPLGTHTVSSSVSQSTLVVQLQDITKKYLAQREAGKPTIYITKRATKQYNVYTTSRSWMHRKTFCMPHAFLFFMKQAQSRNIHQHNTMFELETRNISCWMEVTAHAHDTLSLVHALCTLCIAAVRLGNLHLYSYESFLIPYMYTIQSSSGNLHWHEKKC